MGERIARVPGWCHIAEDSVWDEMPRDPHSPRTEAEKAAVQRRVVALVAQRVHESTNVALDFILYEAPPQPIVYYQTELAKLGVQVITYVLCPSVEQILERQAKRGNSHDSQAGLSERRRNAQHQVACARSADIDCAWLVDSLDNSIEMTYQHFFRARVEE